MDKVLLRCKPLLPEFIFEILKLVFIWGRHSDLFDLNTHMIIAAYFDEVVGVWQPEIRERYMQVVINFLVFLIPPSSRYSMLTADVLLFLRFV